MIRRPNSKKVVFALFFVILVFSNTVLAAPFPEELRESIAQKNEEIKKLEEEAKKIRDALLTKQNEGKTLKNELTRIDGSIKKLRSEITLTQKKIQKTNLEIGSLGTEIKSKEEEIKTHRVGLGSILQVVAETESRTLTEIILQNNFLSDFFGYLNNLDIMKARLVAAIGSLRSLREDLSDKKLEAEIKKDELESLDDELKDRRALQEMERSKRSEILKITNNQEKLYQKLLSETEKKREELQREIDDFERALDITVDESILPQRGSGVIDWPLKELSLESCFGGNLKGLLNCITQFFGNTSFARAGGYNGKGHNGVDFRATVGTPVFSSGNGIVRDTGDTDLSCRRASYGKWILIDHDNNLSTIYAHLSQVKVSGGSSVKRGSLIGYSGSSGYATGPHLHFGLYAAEAVHIKILRSRVCGRDMILPVSPPNGYLNPLDYL